MKKLILLLFICPIVDIAIAQTFHSGNISENETWFASENPQIITGNLTIKNGVTLLIEPGCNIRVQKNRKILVRGTLCANGTSVDPIIFTSDEAVPAAGDWRNIYFNSADAGCILNYVYVCYSGKSNEAILVRNSMDNVLISNSTISHSAGYGIRLQNAAANPSIMNCNFDNNADFPIYTYAGRVQDITGSNVFTNNTPNAIYVRNQTITSATWINQGVPYVIKGNCTVADLEILTISPGVEILFDGNNTFTVNGSLMANGTELDRIKFSSNKPVPYKGDWNRIYLNGAESSSLSYCDFEYAGSQNATIDVRNSGTNVTIMECRIDYSGDRGIYNRNGSLSAISNVDISNCDDYPIHVEADGVGYISGTSTFTGNILQAIWVQGGSLSDNATWVDQPVPYVLGGADLTIPDGISLSLDPGVLISIDGKRTIAILGTFNADGEPGNHIVFTSNQAVPSPGDWKRIWFNGADEGTILNFCEVMYGGATNGNLDIINSGTNVSISNSIISNSGSCGVFIRNGSNPTFINNEIINNNDIGVYINGAAQATFGMDETEWNDIYGNGNYELRNGTLDIDAVNIYWGITACGGIEDLIYDNEDQGNLGVVNYSPYVDAVHGIPVLATNWTGASNTDWSDDGNWDNNTPCGVSDVTVPAYLLNQPIISSSEECNDLTLEAGSQLTIGIGNTLLVTGDLLIEADSTGTGSLVENNGLAVMGNSTSQFYVTEDRWHFVATPMSGQTAITFLDMFLYNYDELTNTFINIVNETTPLNVGEGYEVWSESGITGSNTVEFTGGTYNSGTYYLPVTNAGTGWNFVGNPYPSAIDWDDPSWIKSSIDGTVYIWDGTQYLTWNGSTGSLTGGIIPAMQSFFVKANGPVPFLVVSNGARTHGVSPYKDGSSDGTLMLSVIGNGLSDKTFIDFKYDATPFFDNEYDGHKLYGISDAPQLYTLEHEEELCVNTYPLLAEKRIVPMALEVGAETEYTIIASGMQSFDEGVMIYLEDKQENLMIDLNVQADYTFMASPEDETDRFNVHFLKTTVNVAETELSSLQIYSNTNSVFVKKEGENLNDATIAVYNISGQKVFEDLLQDIPVNRFELTLQSGYYVVKVISGTTVNSEKVFIQ